MALEGVRPTALGQFGGGRPDVFSKKTEEQRAQSHQAELAFLNHIVIQAILKLKAGMRVYVQGNVYVYKLVTNP